MKKNCKSQVIIIGLTVILGIISPSLVRAGGNSSIGTRYGVKPRKQN